MMVGRRPNKVNAEAVEEDDMAILVKRMIEGRILLEFDSDEKPVYLLD